MGRRWGWEQKKSGKDGGVKNMLESLCVPK